MQRSIKHCYDFPEVVIHRTEPEPCARYTGGICYPKPQPLPPYDEDEREAVFAYSDFMQGNITIVRVFRAPGETRGP